MTRSHNLILQVRRNLNDWFGPEWRSRLRSYLQEPFGMIFHRDLPALATIYGTDKWGYHWYAQHYAVYFRHLRRKKIVLVEIGVGGEGKPHLGGASLRMWRRYFPKGTIVGLDLYDKSPHQETRIKIFRGDQSDEAFLRRVISEVGRPDIIIDDGSHINSHVIKSFEVLFPLLADDGIYVVEDTVTSYWPDYEGSLDVNAATNTTMCFFKQRLDGLNYKGFLHDYVPTYYDTHISAVHFYRNLIVIQKGSP